MEFNSPMAVGGIKEIKAVYDANENVNPIQDAENLELDLFTGTATINGIVRREKLLGIAPGDTDSLEERRYRILVKENDRIPYTIRTLRKKLSTLCGKDGYMIFLEEGKLTVKIELAKKNMLDDICRLLENIAPLNMVLDIGLLYNQYQALGTFTYGKLEEYTYAQLREDVIL